MARGAPDIIRTTDSGIVLSNVEGTRWVWRILSLFAASFLFMADSDQFGEAFTSVAPIAIVVWQLGDLKTWIRFNHPAGYLTIRRTPFWSMLIPGGPYFIRMKTQLKLPKTTPFVEQQVRTGIYPVQVGTNLIEIRRSTYTTFQVQLPLEDGMLFEVWSTSWQNTYVEIIRRLNKAIEQSRAASG